MLVHKENKIIRKRYKKEAREKIKIFTVTLNDWTKEDGLESSGAFPDTATFIKWKNALDWARENVEASDSKALGVALIHNDEWVYADSIEIDPSDGEPYAWHDVYGELWNEMYTITSADRRTANAWGLQADEYGVRGR